MSSYTISGSDITVHGRGSIKLPFKQLNANGTEINISALSLWFEVDGLPIREVLDTDPANSLGRRIMLDRIQVESLKTVACPFAVIDETDANYPEVIWTGTIKRSGYKGAPDTLEG